MVTKGVLETCQQKARFAEMIVIDHFKKHPIDLAGANYTSPCDGICPNSLPYDVKSSRFYKISRGFYVFTFGNVYKDEIQILYLIAFNEDYTELKHAWRIRTWEFVDKEKIYIGQTNKSEFNIENMKQKEITDSIRNIFESYGFFEKIKKNLWSF